MLRQPSDWYCTCDKCGDDMSADFSFSPEEFGELLEGQGWIYVCVKGQWQWLCPDCAEDTEDLKKGEN